MSNRPHKLVVYKDHRGELRWRMIARNGKITQAASEGFKQYRGVRRNLATILKASGCRIPAAWPRLAKAITCTWSGRRLSVMVS
jgi:uncharacterized protein YegP (UPF0339 family)